VTRYLVLIAYEPWTWEEASEEVRQSYYRDHEAFSAYVAAHGTEHGSAALADADQATTLRHEGGRRDGAVTVTDGPYAETVEQLTGFYLVDSPDLDDLLEVCKVLGRGEGVIEVREMKGGTSS
jgi:hypothetical protein